MDEDGTLAFLRSDIVVLASEHRQPELFFRTVVITVEVLKPSGQFVSPNSTKLPLFCAGIRLKPSDVTSNVAFKWFLRLFLHRYPQVLFAALLQFIIHKSFFKDLWLES